MKKLRSALVAGLCVLLASCGGHSPWNGSDQPDVAGVPSAPVGLAANAGDGTVSLGWTAPTTNGADPITYNVTISPTANAALLTISGTTALIRGLNNNTSYTFAVTATNSAGTGVAASIQATPATVAARNYSLVTFANNPLLATNGFTDPSLLRAADGRIWMAYSDISATGSGQIIRSATRIAHSNDGGSSYIFDSEVGPPASAALVQANGVWHYRTPALIEDSSDPDATRRFKLFAHKYLFNSADNSFDHQQGAIVMWTAATPDGTWSKEQSLLGWTGTPNALRPLPVVNSLDSALQECLWIDDGSAALYNGGIDLVFSCVTDNTTLVTQRKTILLRSADHLNSFTYVATLLQPIDAANYDAEVFGAPALLPAGGNAPVLIASPIDINGNALGCVVFPIANEQTGVLFTNSSGPLALQTLPAAGSDSGSCGWDRGLLTNGILMSDRAGSTYTLQATGKSL